LSLNKRDPLEGDDNRVKDLGIVSGDLVYVISKCGQSNNTTADLKSGSVMACLSDGSESIINSGVAKMETEAISGKETETVMNVNGGGDRQMECDKTMSDVSEVKSSVSVMHTESVDSVADNTQETATEAAGQSVIFYVQTS